MNPKALSGIAIVACLCLIARCKRHSRVNGVSTHNVSSNGRSEVTLTDGRRYLHVVADHRAEGAPSSNSFLVVISHHVLVIEKDRLLIDKIERAKFPADAKEFEGTLTAGTLTVNIDGTPVLATPLK